MGCGARPTGTMAYSSPALRRPRGQAPLRGCGCAHDPDRRTGAGTVNLIGSGHDKAHEARSHEGLCPSGHAGDLGPGLEGLGPGGSVLAGGEVIAAEVEEVVDLVVSGEKPLGLTG